MKHDRKCTIPTATGHLEQNHSVVSESKLVQGNADSFTGDNPVRQAEAGSWSWSGVREKHYYLAGGWRRELEEWKRGTL